MIGCTYILITTALGQWYWYEAVNKQNRDNQSTLSQFQAQLQAQLEQFSYLPRLLSKDRELIDALNAPFNSAQLDITNRYLENVNRIIGAADTYLLDNNGTTIASSNWLSETSFIGRNFAFRPYFQQALQGTTGQYFALGSTSAKRGYYYAYPIHYGASLIGVIVIKMDLSLIEQDWITKGATYIVTDRDNIVFMSSRQQWLFHSLLPLSPDRTREIQQERRYLDLPISSLGFLAIPNSQQGRITQKRTPISADTFYYAHHPLPNHQLKVWVLSKQQTLVWGLLRFLVFLHLVYALIISFWLFSGYRKRKLQQLNLLQAQSQQKLEFEVMARTAKLQVEIKERTLAEQRLLQAQQDLIQAAKLALLGKLSASISHELNNPLAAIRSFSDNGVKFIERGDYDRAKQNLEKIVSLTERMAKISQQLRAFARKSSTDDAQWVEVLPILELALELTRPEAMRCGLVINPHQSPNLPLPLVKVHAVQLEQVFINLITNAIQATASCKQKQIDITLTVDSTWLNIAFDDSGTGIDPELQSMLFEPFVTNKTQGLGLGLSISKELIDSMKGTLTAGNSDLGGACFTVMLPYSYDPTDPSETR
ncbi:sensor histidine kinase [Vibrio ulleungensis]|uniref:histidine kinase n=1 Tax=Vibrio ulleungensis TaxID=2807619 RepID=A0ABS2HKN1_9VIBR|nr:ATP-binding protein [Vibrio ulleungensis]MBM7036361.1 sensor histidine kinase [Vibrio ulleungensis]